MKKSILAVMMLFSVAVFFVSCKEQPKEEVATEKGESLEMAMNDVYMCDMGCKEYAEPGDCECGMELKKVEKAATDSVEVEESHEGHDH
ncbi:MAG: hypothetical protein Q8J84_05265 [Flavobacteriaceae bacterium]|nr:hypothetical protein [Flavobacteriaceae bacterium]